MKYLVGIALCLFVCGLAWGDVPPGWPPPSYVTDRQWQNVMDYGAVRDTSMDASTAFNDALSATGDSGGVVFIPSGDFKLDDTFHIDKANVRIVGAGEASRIFIDSAGAALMSIEASNISLENFTIVCSDTSYSNGTIYTDSTGCSDILIKDVRFHGGGNQIRFHTVSNFTIANTYHDSLTACGYPISLWNCSEGLIDGVTIQDYTAVLCGVGTHRSVVVQASEHIRVVNISINNIDFSLVNTGAGITFYDCSYCLLDGALITNLINGDAVLTENASHDIVISDGVFRQNGVVAGVGGNYANGDGVDIYNSYRVTISNCIAFGNGLYSGGYHPGFEIWGSSEILISNCISDSNGLDGYRIINSPKVSLISCQANYNRLNGVTFSVSACSVNTVADTVFRVGGPSDFNTGWRHGTKIRINDVFYLIDSIWGYDTITLQTSAGTQDTVTAYVPPYECRVIGGSYCDNNESNSSNAWNQCGIYFDAADKNIVIGVIAIDTDTVGAKKQVYGLRAEGISEVGMIANNFSFNKDSGTYLNNTGIALPVELGEELGLVGRGITADNDTITVYMDSLGLSLSLMDNAQTAARGGTIFFGGAGDKRYAAIRGELYTAVGNHQGDIAFYVRLNTANTYLSKAMHLTVEGNLSLDGHRVIGMADPVNDSDAVTKLYGDANYGAGGTSDSTGVDTGGVAGVDNFLYPPYLKEGTNVVFSVTGDTLTIAGPAASGTKDSVGIDTDGVPGTIEGYLNSYGAGPLGVLSKSTNITFTLTGDTLLIASTGAGAWTIAGDTIHLIDADNDTLARFHDDDLGNVWWRTGADQSLRIVVDTLGIGGDVIKEFAGTRLSVTAGNLNVDLTGALINLTTEVTGILPDGNVADNITASNYLPLVGGALSGSVTIAVDSTFDGKDVSTLTDIGQTIESAEITDGTVAEVDMKIVNVANDEEILTFETTTGDFEWHTPAELNISTTDHGHSLSDTLMRNDGDAAVGDYTFSGGTVGIDSIVTATDTITDFTGTGLERFGTALQTTLGTSVEYGEITATTSSNWATRVSDETGTGAWVFGTSPAFTTSITIGADSILDHYIYFENGTTDEYFMWDSSVNRFALSDDFDVTGNITVSGTVDGVDVLELHTDYATDSTKLAGIESGATADQTDAEIEAIIGPFIDTTTLDTIQNAHKAVLADSATKALGDAAGNAITSTYLPRNLFDDSVANHLQWDTTTSKDTIKYTGNTDDLLQVERHKVKMRIKVTPSSANNSYTYIDTIWGDATATQWASPVSGTDIAMVCDSVVLYINNDADVNGKVTAEDSTTYYVIKSDYYDSVFTVATDTAQDTTTTQANTDTTHITHPGTDAIVIPGIVSQEDSAIVNLFFVGGQEGGLGDSIILQGPGVANGADDTGWMWYDSSYSGSADIKDSSIICEGYLDYGEHLNDSCISITYIFQTSHATAGTSSLWRYRILQNYTNMKTVVVADASVAMDTVVEFVNVGGFTRNAKVRVKFGAHFSGNSSVRCHEAWLVFK